MPERDREREALGLGARLHDFRHALEPRRDAEDLLLRALADVVEPRHRVDRPELDLLLDDLQVVARPVNPGAPNHVGHLAEVRHVDPRHVDRRHDLRRRRQRAIRVALQHFLEDRAIERVVPRLFLRDVHQHLADQRLVLARDPSRVGVAHLRRPLLQRGVHEHAIGVLVPARLEARLQVLELHALEHRILENPAVARIVVQHRAVPVFLRGPQVRPLGPERVAAQVRGEQAVEVRQPLFRQQVHRERHARRHADPLGASAQLLHVRVRIGVGGRGEQFAREPQDALGLVRHHELLDDGLEIREHFDLGERFEFGIDHGAVSWGAIAMRRHVPASDEY